MELVVTFAAEESSGLDLNREGLRTHVPVSQVFLIKPLVDCGPTQNQPRVPIHCSYDY